MALGTGVAEEDPDLAVGPLAQRARVHARHPHRLLPLLGKARLIQDEHTRPIAEPLSQVALHALDQHRIVPPRLAQEALQRPRVRPLDCLRQILR